MSLCTSNANAVLIADDDKTIREMEKCVLSAKGFTVLLAKDGTEAIDIYIKNQDTIGCILLDMQMPGLNGIEVCTKLRELKYEVPVILLSGRQDSDFLNEVNDAGISDTLEKPCRASDLVNKISIVLGGAAPVNSNSS